MDTHDPPAPSRVHGDRPWLISPVPRPSGRQARRLLWRALTDDRPARILGLLALIGPCALSNRELGNLVGLSRGSVSRAVRRLRELGYLEQWRAGWRGQIRVLRLRVGDG